MNNTGTNQDQNALYYRGQLMSLTKINNLQKLIGQHVIVLNFFSTTTDVNVAKVVGGVGSFKSNEQIQAVLFQIDIRQRKESFQMYADISSFTQFSDELETLFLAGTIFYIRNVAFISMENYWIVEFVLSHEWPVNVRNIFASAISFDVKLLKLDLISHNRSATLLEKLEQYYNTLLHDSSMTLTNQITCYTGLGRIADRRGVNDLALSLLFKGVDIFKEFIRTTKHFRILSSPEYYQSRFSLPASFFNLSRRDYYLHISIFG
ncbi:unnamed protein product [Rotaria sp. Silwood2]|nr:unnamed protein product [Rotaria sp. Silwood2]CAF4288062.1 unnamed protein product [Rotaria sp. Silwood2]